MVESQANKVQYGGTHYKRFQGAEPWDIISQWGLGYLDGTALKYIARWRHKNGTEDIRKAIHFLEKLLEVEAARSAPPSVEPAPNRSPVVCERQLVQTSRSIYDATTGASTTGDVSEFSRPTDWPFPNYLGTGSSRYPTEDSLNDAVERLRNLRPVDEQVGDSFPVYASNVENMPILRADTDDV